MNGNTRAVVRRFTERKRRARWLAGVTPALAASLAAALDAPSSKGFVIRDDGQGRFRYKWGSSTVQFYLLPKGDGRTSVVVTHLKLENASALEESRAQWRAALAALARLSIDD